jgi:hypothetical protein
MGKQVDVGRVHAEDMPVLAAALKLWIRNARAGSGTVKGLGDEAGSKDWQERANDIETRLLPKFEEQGALELADTKA